MKPMLAHDYKKRGHNIRYPAYVQPKLDGIRCLAKMEGTKITYTSRDEKPFPAVSHLTEHLLRVMKDGDTWDGELFTKALTFQEIVSAVKRNKTTNPHTKLIEYWVYDCVMNATFEERHLYIDSRIKNGGPIKPVPTVEVVDEKAMLACHDVMISKGYEGTMIRNKHGLYIPKRSADLQKYKDMEDAEFTITGAKQGEGKDVGCIIFVCTTDKGLEFDCRPNGSYERRENWWRNRQSLIGKKLTVQFQGYTDDGKPRFPIGKEVRDYE